MIDSSKHDFITLDLNPDLLSTPFGVQTNWHVITGAPSCGKTTLVNLLADKGFKTIPETARQYMEREVAIGRTTDEIHADGAALQRCLVDIQLSIESELRVTDAAFLDGAVPGSLAWYRVFGLNPNIILQECFHRRYASVFILDRLPLQLDGLRFEDEAYIDFLDEWIPLDYRALGYRVVMVPVLAPQDRLAFILDRLSEQGLI